MAGGGGNGGLVGYLPVAAALAATVMTDGAAAPMLGEALGAEAGTMGATVLGAGAMGALTGGSQAALTGGDILKGTAIGGLGGAALGGLGAAWGGNGVPTTDLGQTIGAGGPMEIPAGDFATAGNSFTGVGGATSGASNVTSALPGELSDIPVNETGNLAYNPTTVTTPTNAVSSGAQGLGATTPGSQLLAQNPNAAKYMGYGATALGLGAMMQADNKKYGTPSPASQKYSGPLTKFKYDPNQYQPATTPQPNPAYQPVYANYAANPFMAAEGGTVPGYEGGGLLDPNSEPVDFMGGDMYPQSQQQRSFYATPSQAPTSAQQVMASYEPKTNPLTGEPSAHMAAGGIAAAPRLKEGAFVVPADVVSHIGNGSTDAGLKTLGKHIGAKPIKGPGDGMSDSIATKIGQRQPARVADGEAVVEPETVKKIGKGSADKGAKKLYSMMDKVRQARTGTKQQGKQIKAEKYLPV